MVDPNMNKTHTDVIVALHSNEIIGTLGIVALICAAVAFVWQRR
jgi:hypothetical protein